MESCQESPPIHGSEFGASSAERCRWCRGMEIAECHADHLRAFHCSRFDSTWFYGMSWDGWKHDSLRVVGCFCFSLLGPGIFGVFHYGHFYPLDTNFESEPSRLSPKSSFSKPNTGRGWGAPNTLAATCLELLGGLQPGCQGFSLHICSLDVGRWKGWIGP